MSQISILEAIPAEIFIYEILLKYVYPYRLFLAAQSKYFFNIIENKNSIERGEQFIILDDFFRYKNIFLHEYSPLISLENKITIKLNNKYFLSFVQSISKYVSIITTDELCYHGCLAVLQYNRKNYDQDMFNKIALKAAASPNKNTIYIFEWLKNIEVKFDKGFTPKTKDTRQIIGQPVLSLVFTMEVAAAAIEFGRDDILAFFRSIGGVPFPKNFFNIIDKNSYNVVMELIKWKGEEHILNGESINKISRNADSELCKFLFIKKFKLNLENMNYKKLEFLKYIFEKYQKNELDNNQFKLMDDEELLFNKKLISYATIVTTNRDNYRNSYSFSLEKQLLILLISAAIIDDETDGFAKIIYYLNNNFKDKLSFVEGNLFDFNGLHIKILKDIFPNSIHINLHLLNKMIKYHEKIYDEKWIYDHIDLFIKYDKNSKIEEDILLIMIYKNYQNLIKKFLRLTDGRPLKAYHYLKLLDYGYQKIINEKNYKDTFISIFTILMESIDINNKKNILDLSLSYAIFDLKCVELIDILVKNLYAETNNYMIPAAVYTKNFNIISSLERLGFSWGQNKRSLEFYIQNHT